MINVQGDFILGDVKVKNGEVLNADWDALHAHTREAATRLWKEA